MTSRISYIKILESQMASWGYVGFPWATNLELPGLESHLRLKAWPDLRGWSWSAAAAFAGAGGCLADCRERWRATRVRIQEIVTRSLTG